MWPGQGSGFDADPFSPAGTAQREWMLTQRLGRSRLGKLVVWLILFSDPAPTSQSCLAHQPFGATARGRDAFAVMATRQAVASPTMGALR
jgi:hypothetical protein